MDFPPLGVILIYQLQKIDFIFVAFFECMYIPKYCVKVLYVVQTSQIKRR